MKINFYEWNKTPIEIKEKVLKRSEADIADVESSALKIIQDVKANGDAALVKYAKLYDKAESLDVSSIKATKEDFVRAEKNLPQDIKDAIKRCAGNVRIHHEAQMKHTEKRWIEEVETGVFAGEQINPIPSIGIYVPRGKGSFPSVMYMLCTPAVVAGVKDIHVCTPPTPEGDVDDASLYAAQICGVKNVYKSGGAQAIAAFAYGTETIPKVHKVSGPGSPYVAVAKRLLSNEIDPGMPAGPSEALIVADKTANPHNTALDVINEAEHGPDSASILVTDSRELAEKVRELLPDLINALPDPRDEFCKASFSKYGGIVLVDNLDEMIEFSNQYAVEHLHLKVENPNEVLPRLQNTGEILIGENTPIVAGNFGIGVNAILPTGRHAMTSSCTSIWDFLKRTSIAYCTEKGMNAIKGDVLKLADYEGFPGHADVLRKRKSVSSDGNFTMSDFED